jgi:hypothetical protein
MKELGQNSQKEGTQQDGGRSQKTDVLVKEMKETRQPAGFKLYGLGKQLKQYRSEDFSLYGVEHSQPEPFDLYGVAEPHSGPFDLYGVEEDESK